MKTNDLLAIILILVSIILFFLSTGTVTSGYHFCGDHSILRLNDAFSTTSILTITANEVKRDLNQRFRPMFFFHHVLESKLFGKNLTAWSLYTIFLLFCTILCFYYGMRKLKFSISESLCFLILVFIGRQMAMWWSLVIGETIGMVFLGLAFYFMVNCEKRYVLNTGLFCFFLICASLCKESFLIIIPAFLIFKILYEKGLYRLSLKKAVLKNYLLLIPFFEMIIGLSIIVFVVGTNKVGYAGVSGSIFHLLKGMLSIIENRLIEYTIIVAVFIVAVCFGLKDKNKILLFSKKLILPFLFFVLIAVPSLILYAKCGIKERYLLPFLVGIAFFIVSIIKETRPDLRWLSVLFLVVILAFSIKPASLAFKFARVYTNVGVQNEVFLSGILDNYEESSNVLLVADPVASYEWSYSLNVYLSLAKGIEFYVYTIEKTGSYPHWPVKFKQRLKDRWYLRYKQRMLSDMKGKPDMILFFQKALAQRFFNESGIQKENYFNILTNNTRYAIYMENTVSFKTFPCIWTRDRRPVSNRLLSTGSSNRYCNPSGMPVLFWGSSYKGPMLSPRSLPGF